MTAPRDAKTYLDDILHAVQSIEQYTMGMVFENFSTDTKTQDAVVRNLEVIFFVGKFFRNRFMN